ncbi:hypothetical protein [Actinomadura fibrosa]|uniref:SH3 domain-containing protein n=1 Tax=Actinomadura fibrosa TaxID=111802 RepID=A0ABW2XGH4_9ACTN|nr:hypothetical protein [Actinomadura fibrosa]
MRTSSGTALRAIIRTAIAVSVSGLAAGGFAFLAPVSGASAAGPPAAAPPPAPICRYTVEARHGTWVRSSPGGHGIGRLRHGKLVFADCNARRGWVRLQGQVPQIFLYKWVARRALERY